MIRRSALALRAPPDKVHPAPSPVSSGCCGGAQISPFTFFARSLAPRWNAARAALSDIEAFGAMTRRTSISCC